MKKYLLLLLLIATGCGGSANMSMFRKPGAKVNKSASVVILSENANAWIQTDNTFRDILATELLKNGLDVVDKNALKGILESKGVSWSDIQGGQYNKIADNSNVKTVIMLSGEMAGQMISKANCKVLDAATGSTLLTMNITNPAPYQPIYIGNKSTESIAKEWAEQIASQD